MHTWNYTLVASITTMLLSACSYYVPVTHSPTKEAFGSAGTTNVQVTQLRTTGAVGWHVRNARLDSAGLHGRFYPMAADQADKAHHLRKPKDANRLGKVVLLHLRPDHALEITTAAEVTIPVSAIAEMVITEKDRKKSATRTVGMVGVSVLAVLVVLGLLIAPNFSSMTFSL